MWTEKDNKLYRSFTFKNFVEAFGFMAKVAITAEQMNHHPYWTNLWLHGRGSGHFAGRFGKPGCLVAASHVSVPPVRSNGTRFEIPSRRKN